MLVGAQEAEKSEHWCLLLVIDFENIYQNHAHVKLASSLFSKVNKFTRYISNPTRAQPLNLSDLNSCAVFILLK